MAGNKRQWSQYPPPGMDKPTAPHQPQPTAQTLTGNGSKSESGNPPARIKQPWLKELQARRPNHELIDFPMPQPRRIV